MHTYAKRLFLVNLHTFINMKYIYISFLFTKYRTFVTYCRKTAIFCSISHEILYILCIVSQIRHFLG